eukprot:4909910-Ditylum_brightwellii.AAC.1
MVKTPTKSRTKIWAKSASQPPLQEMRDVFSRVDWRKVVHRSEEQGSAIKGSAAQRSVVKG